MKSIKQNDKKMISKSICFFIGLAAFSVLIFDLGLSGCSLTGEGISALEKGSLHVLINSGGTAWRSLLPDTDMVPARYSIKGSGPSGASFERVSTAGDSDGDGLAAGEWKVSVTAINADGLEIGYGESTVVIEKGKLSTVTIEVCPLSGTGTLTLSVVWSSDEAAGAGLKAFLTDSSGNTQPLLFDMGIGTAAYYNSIVTAGYYTLTLQLLDGETILGGIVDSVRIVKGASTEGSYSFTDINHPTGNAAIVVTVDLNEPLEVEISGVVPILDYGESMTSSISITNAPDVECIYSWYLNGSYIGAGETAAVGADLHRGNYRLNAVVFTADGNRSGSAEYNFTVE